MSFKDFQESIENPALYSTSFETLEFESVKETHFLLETSGSSEKKKYIHSTSCIEKACLSFGEVHPLDKKDRWWLSLSSKHVAGFSILARSHYLQLKPPYENPFTMNDLSSVLVEEEITVLSLVPTQIYDIVQNGFKAPTHLKYVFVGGAKLSSDLFSKGKKLGWPIVVCYGSTETFAQMSSSYDNETFQLYPGWSFHKKDSKIIELEGPGLFSYKEEEKRYVKREVAFVLEDQIDFDENKNTFKLLGREDGKYKHKGSYQDFQVFKEQVEAFLLSKSRPRELYIPMVVEDERAGGLFYIAVDKKEHDTVAALFEEVPALQGAFYIENITNYLSDLKKPQKSKLSDALKRPLLYV